MALLYPLDSGKFWVVVEPDLYRNRTNIMSFTIRHMFAALVVAVTATSCGSDGSNVGTSEPTTTTIAVTTSTAQPKSEETQVDIDENEDQIANGFGDLSALITETATFTGPTGQSVKLVAEIPDPALPLELSLIIGEWTESYQRDDGEVVLSKEIAYSFEIAYACSLTSGWLTNVEESTFQWKGGFTPSGDESLEDCDEKTSDLTFVNDLGANDINLKVVNNTLTISFDRYEATWVPDS